MACPVFETFTKSPTAASYHEVHEQIRDCPLSHDWTQLLFHKTTQKTWVWIAELLNQVEDPNCIAFAILHEPGLSAATALWNASKHRERSFLFYFWESFFWEAVKARSVRVPWLTSILEMMDVRVWTNVLQFGMETYSLDVLLPGVDLVDFVEQHMDTLPFLGHLLIAAYCRAIPLMERLSTEARLFLMLQDTTPAARCVHGGKRPPLCACVLRNMMVFLCCDSKLRVRPELRYFWSTLAPTSSTRAIHLEHLRNRSRAHRALTARFPVQDCNQIILEFLYSPSWNLESFLLHK